MRGGARNGLAALRRASDRGWRTGEKGPWNGVQGPSGHCGRSGGAGLWGDLPGDLDGASMSPSPPSFVPWKGGGDGPESRCVFFPGVVLATPWEKGLRFRNRP